MNLINRVLLESIVKILKMLTWQDLLCRAKFHN